MIDSTGRDAYSCEMNEIKCPRKTTDLDADRPVCDAHGKPMTKTGRQRGRQAWRCSVAKAAYNARPEVKAAKAAYEASDEGKATRAAYEASDEGKAAKAAHAARPEVKARWARWNNGRGGLLAQARHGLKKRRQQREQEDSASE